MLRIVINNDRLIRALLEAGRMSEDASRRREQVEKEAAAVLAEWAARWLR